MEKAEIFEDIKRKYLQEIGEIDFISRAQILGAEVRDGALIIPFYDKYFSVSDLRIHDLSGDGSSHAVKVMLCKYILMCPDRIPEKSDRLVTFREYKDAAPLTSYFVNNTNKTIETAFSANISALEERCLEIGGLREDSSSHDLSMKFFALPRVPVILNFNDCDDMFPASCSILYQASAENYLDMESLSITGTYLTGKLIGQ